jgi:phosphoserine phosphatase RsbU/P
MQCMEVWGGNQITDAGVVMAGLDAWVYCRPFGGVDNGGDVYYVSSCATGRITRLLVADVSGHGQAVSSVAGQLRALMRKHVNQIDQSRFVGAMNQQFGGLSKTGCFATALVTTFFAPTRSLSICNAGHPPPLLYRAVTKTWSYLDQRTTCGDEFGGNIPLGIMDLANYDQFDVRLRVGDLVVCYTDSLIEARDGSGAMLGRDGLLRLANQIDTGEPARLMNRLLAAVEGWCGGGGLCDDDVTVLVFRPNGLASAAPMRERAVASLRVVRGFLASLWNDGEAAALPEFTLANVGGAIFGPLNQLWARRRGRGKVVLDP